MTACRFFLLGLVVAVSCFSVGARQVELAPADASPYADTEVSTNLLFNLNPDLLGVEIDFRLDGCPSNSVQVAFGRDADADGVLDADETETVFGGRNGRWFAENFLKGERLEETMAGNSSNRVLSVTVALTRTGGVKRFAATNEAGVAVFSALSDGRPDWAYRSDWNLIRVTRRGPGVPSEWFACDQKSVFFHVLLR